MLSIPRRRPLVWALCAVLSAAAWALLLTGREAAGVGLMFAGGWNISLLPVHARPWTARRGRRTVRKDPSASGGPPGAGDPAPDDPWTEDPWNEERQNAEA